MKALLKMKGINLNHADENGCTALSAAAWKGHHEVFWWLMGKKGIHVNNIEVPQGALTLGNSPLSIAAQKGHTKMIKLMLSKDGINVNQADARGVTPLINAARFGHDRVVKLLLTDRSIKVNQADEDGITPLIWAATQGNLKIVQMLLGQKDININLSHKNGKTPLSMAVQEGHTEVVSVLKRKITTPSNQAATCIVCLDLKPDVALVPCGHQNMCGACAHQWNEEQKGCPIDRTKILEILPLKRESEEPTRKKSRHQE